MFYCVVMFFVLLTPAGPVVLLLTDNALATVLIPMGVCAPMIIGMMTIEADMADLLQPGEHGWHAYKQTKLSKEREKRVYFCKAATGWAMVGFLASAVVCVVLANILNLQ